MESIDSLQGKLDKAEQVIREANADLRAGKLTSEQYNALTTTLLCEKTDLIIRIYGPIPTVPPAPISALPGN